MKMVINIYLLMAILSFNSCDENTASPYVPPQEEHDSIPATTEHLTTRSTIADVLAHPAFEGFSQYILPLEWGYDEDMPLSDVERLLPYHNYIDAERCVGYINQMIDSVAAGIEYIFRHATELQVDTAGYSVWGSSAGARMAAYIGSYGTAAFGAARLPRPRTVVMAYTGHSEYTRQDPPTYAVAGSNDGIANPNTMRRRTEALQAIGIPAEFHLYPNLRHGFGLGIGTSAEGWIDGAVRFWEENR